MTSVSTIAVEDVARALAQQELAFLAARPLDQQGDPALDVVDVAGPVRVAARRLVVALVEQLLGRLLRARGRTCRPARRRRAGARRRRRAAGRGSRIVLPHRLVALGVGEDGPEPGARRSKKRCVELGREGRASGARRAPRGRRGRGAPRRSPGARTRRRRGSARSRDGRRAARPGRRCVERRPRRGRSKASASAARVVEHARAHVRRRHHVLEAGASQRAEQSRPSSDGPRAVVDAGDPVAVEVDEAGHVRTLALAREVGQRVSVRTRSRREPNDE